MKIGSIDTKPVVPASTQERKAPDKAGVGAAEASAKVELSPAASALAKLSADPSFDAAKVERIAQAIRDGKFEVNPEAIADKLIENAKELLSRKPS